MVKQLKLLFSCFSLLKVLQLHSPSPSESKRYPAVSEDQVKEVERLLPHLQLERLFLLGDWMTDQILERLSSAISQLQQLQVLNLSFSRLTSQCLDTLSRILPKLTSIRLVDVQDSQFEEVNHCHDDLAKFRAATSECAEFRFLYSVMKDGKSVVKDEYLGKRRSG